MLLLLLLVIPDVERVSVEPFSFKYRFCKGVAVDEILGNGRLFELTGSFDKILALLGRLLGLPFKYGFDQSLYYILFLLFLKLSLL